MTTVEIYPGTEVHASLSHIAFSFVLDSRNNLVITRGEYVATFPNIHGRIKKIMLSVGYTLSFYMTTGEILIADGSYTHSFIMSPKLDLIPSISWYNRIYYTCRKSNREYMYHVITKELSLTEHKGLLNHFAEEILVRYAIKYDSQTFKQNLKKSIFGSYDVSFKFDS